MKTHFGLKTFKSLGRIFNVREWFDWYRLKAYTLYLRDNLRSIFILQDKKKTESFENAVAQFNLSEDQLVIQQKALYRLTIIMVTCACLIFIYAGYQLFFGSWHAFLLTFVVMLIALTLAFRYHFWYFQIKQRKLGCTFIEWFKQGLLGESK